MGGMRTRTWVYALAAILLARAGGGQTAPADLRERIGALRYPRIAEASRVSGDVRLQLHQEQATVVTGPPMLRGLATQAARIVGSIPGMEDVEVICHFALTDVDLASEPTRVKRGNGVERFF